MCTHDLHFDICKNITLKCLNNIIVWCVVKRQQDCRISYDFTRFGHNRQHFFWNNAQRFNIYILGHVASHILLILKFLSTPAICVSSCNTVLQHIKHAIISYFGTGWEVKIGFLCSVLQHKEMKPSSPACRSYKGFHLEHLLLQFLSQVFSTSMQKKLFYQYTPN